MSNQEENEKQLTFENIIDDKQKLIKLSVSKVKVFDHCKAQYKYNYIDHLTKKEWAHHSFGLFLHEVLENFHAEYLNGCLDSYSKTMSRIYKISLKKFSAKLSPEAKTEAFGIIDKYLKKIAFNPKEVKSIISVEKKFTIPITDKIILTGMIDRVQLDNDNVICVCDYKTIKNKKYLKNDFIQMQTYAYALYQEDNSITKVRASYILLRHDFEYFTKEFDINDIKEIEEKYKQYAEDIHNEKVYRANPTPLCNYCDFLNVCNDGKSYVNRGIKKFGEVQW